GHTLAILRGMRRLRICYAGRLSPNAVDLPGSRLWYANLREPLARMGHEVIDFQWDSQKAYVHLNQEVPAHRAFIQQHRPLCSAELLRQISAAHREKPVDLFFSYFYSCHVEPQNISAIRRLGILTVNWYCNASYQFHLVREIAPAYDYCLVPERFRLEDYRRIGARPIYCQEAADPEVYRPYDLPQDLDVIFIGQCYGERPNYIRHLWQAGIAVRVWGPGWQEKPVSAFKRLWRALKRRWRHRAAIPPEICGPSLSDEEMVKMYSRSKIALGFTSVAAPAPGEKQLRRQVRLRDFEVAMCGAFYLVEECDELADFFAPGREIIFFRDAHDLIAKCRYYLAHADERQRIREAARQRALAEHTWEKRWAMVLAQIGLA
ncbi:MAG: glycosyltransferase, partial [Planctomycetota bacterium]|nr:glycosyltransferase [Planctomycetota bacterium]